MNKKNCKIIKVNGLRGLLFLVFIASCMVTGFVICPAWVCMHLWNYAASFFYNIPAMNLVQGVILWAIIALTVYGLNGSRFLVGFSTTPTLNEDQIRTLMERVKTATLETKLETNIEPSSEIENKEETFEEIRK